MNKSMRILAAFSIVVLAACSETNRNTSPVELVASTTQTRMVIDLLNPQSTPLGTIQLRAIQKSNDTTVPSDSRFLDVKLLSYRVSYRRTDGGTQVPAPFVRTTSGIIPVGGSASPLDNFVILTTEALSQAPFVALAANNGGVDPETGQRVVKFDAIVEIFGETLSGQNVYAQTVVPLWVCAGCSAA